MLFDSEPPDTTKITMVLKVSERVHPPICPRVLLGSLLSLAQKPSASLLFLWCLVILNQKTYTNIVILIIFDHSESKNNGNIIIFVNFYDFEPKPLQNHCCVW